MRYVVRSLATLALVVGVAIFSVSSTLTTVAITLAAHTTALIMGGTFHPLVNPPDPPNFVRAYLDNAVGAHLEPSFPDSGAITNAVAVFTPEEFFPLGRLTLDKSVAAGRANLNRCLAASPECVINTDVGSALPAPGDAFLVFGFSQSAIIASLTKRDLIEAYEPGDPVTPIELVSDPMRPNGGILMRFKGFPTIPIFGISFVGASPTNSADLGGGDFAYPTVDIARQYDALGGDFPLRPLNLLATANSLIAYALLHAATVDVPFDQARFQGSTGDTRYYMLTADILPLLQPLQPLLPDPILRALDAPLRVLVENAYDRDISPGTPTRARLWPVHNLLALTRDLLRSLPVAVDNLVEGFGGRRVFGTTAPGAFGVGKPDLPAPAEPAPVVTGRVATGRANADSGDDTDDDTDDDTARPSSRPGPTEAAEPAVDAAEPAVDAPEPESEPTSQPEPTSNPDVDRTGDSGQGESGQGESAAQADTDHSGAAEHTAVEGTPTGQAEASASAGAPRRPAADRDGKRAHRFHRAPSGDRPAAA